MSLPSEIMPVGLLGTGAVAAEGYAIERSVRFNSADSAYLSKTFASTGNRKTWTWAGWVKRGALGVVQQIFASRPTVSPYSLFYFFTDNKLAFDNGISSFSTNAVFSDSSAWYHIVFWWDSTQATGANRIKLYVNGVEQTFASASYPTQNADGQINTATNHTIGKGGNYTNEHFNGYLADVHFIDGQALDPTSFGEFDDNGIWQPIEYTGSYGTNGFHLPFDDNSTAAALGTDTSGNGNTWTVNNISVTAGSGNDSLVDVPVNGTETDTGVGGEVRGNYATLNPLDLGSGLSLTNGNLDFARGGTTNWQHCRATIEIPATGKWYWEVTFNGGSTDGTLIGVATAAADLSNSLATATGFYAFTSYPQLFNNAGGTSFGSSPAAGDIMQVAFDRDNNKLWFGINNTFFNSGNPSTGANAAISSVPANVRPICGSRSTSSASANFGQRPFAYTAPSGYKALNTANLPAPVITKPSTVMGIVQYTGNSSTQTVTGLDFNPDFIWSKSRSGTFGHGLFDSVRGVSRALASHSTNAEGVGATGTGVTAFNSNGFSLGPDDGAFTGYINYTGSSQVAWCWDAGDSTVTNTDGSITSSVRANPSAGFSIVSYTGSGSNATVGHGLGVAPAMIMFKKRSNTQNWVVYHSAMGATKALYLDQTVAAVTASNFFQDTQPTSSVFSLGTGNGVNTISQTFIAYCFAPVESYSAFGSYIGNGSSTDGPFVYTGFRPRWILVKSTGATGWAIIDAARDAYNLSTKQLFPHDPAAEFDSSTQYLVADLLSNGFKLRTTSSASNTSSQSYVYCAFAESPFQYSRAR